MILRFGGGSWRGSKEEARLWREAERAAKRSEERKKKKLRARESAERKQPSLKQVRILKELEKTYQKSSRLEQSLQNEILDLDRRLRVLSGNLKKAQIASAQAKMAYEKHYLTLSMERRKAFAQWPQFRRNSKLIL